MRSLVRGVVVTGVLFCGVGQAIASSATGSEPDQTGPVRVEVSADMPQPESGDVVTYTLRVKNVSETDYSHLDVFQMVPSGFRVTETTPRTTVDKNRPEWTAAVPAGATAVFSVTATAGRVADYEHSTSTVKARSNPGDSGGASAGKPDPAVITVTTTACARAAAYGPALACGTARQTLSDSADGTGSQTRWQPGVLLLGFVLVGAVGLRGWVRKRRVGKGRA